ncbi:MAG: hypothetical protein ACYCZI_11745, partial [Metallibacterium scheffleri]
AICAWMYCSSASRNWPVVARHEAAPFTLGMSAQTEIHPRIVVPTQPRIHPFAVIPAQAGIQDPQCAGSPPARA